jgi:CubicO group peptidase (beta-lactamase class C family)
MKKSRMFFSVCVLAAFSGIGFNPADHNAAFAKSASEKIKYVSQGEYTGRYWPTTGWRTCKPEAVGMDSQKLAEAMEYAAISKFNSEGIVVIKNGYVTAEAYLGSFRKDSKHVSHSMAKSCTSALVGIAIDKGLIKGVDERVCQYYDEWNCNDEGDFRSRIAIRHAMTLTTGLEWHEDWSTWDPATNDALKMGASGYFVKYMSERDGLHEPGQQFTYSTGDPMLLSRVIQEATGMTAFAFAKQHLFKPLNMTNVQWDKDRDGYTSTAWGLHTRLYGTMRNSAISISIRAAGRISRLCPKSGWKNRPAQTPPSKCGGPTDTSGMSICPTGWNGAGLQFRWTPFPRTGTWPQVFWVST